MGDTAVLENPVAQRNVEQLTKTVESRIDRLELELLGGHSQPFLEALGWWQQFHQYSFSNAQLIQAQYPHATAVAGYRQLQAMGWQVKRVKQAKQMLGWS